MTLLQLLTQLRVDLDDTEEDYLWSDDELKRYINEALNEAVRRSRLIIDQATAEVCEIPVLVGQSLYQLHRTIYMVLDVHASWDDGPLCKWTTDEMNMRNRGWRNETSDAPNGYVLDFQSGALMLAQKPTAAGTLNLRVYRLPLVELVDDNDTPEIAEHLHRKLLHWAKHEAYLKPDSDTLNTGGSADALALFEREFGEAKSVWADEFDNRRLPYGAMDGAY